jgi:hypothetical protein
VKLDVTMKQPLQVLGGGYATTPYWKPMSVGGTSTSSSGYWFLTIQRQLVHSSLANVVPCPPSLSVQSPSPRIYARSNLGNGIYCEYILFIERENE